MLSTYDISSRLVLIDLNPIEHIQVLLLNHYVLECARMYCSTLLYYYRYIQICIDTIEIEKILKR